MNKSSRFAQEAKRQELIKNLSASGWYGLSDGRTLNELTLQELQDIQRWAVEKNHE